MAADAVGARGTIVGVDVSLPMLRGALAKPGPRPIRLAAMDGQALALRHEIFDTVISQLGLMFFPSRVAGVREARRVLRPGGRFAALVWGALEQMPWFGGLAEELLPQFPARREDLFRGVSLGAPGRLEGVLAEAGLRGVSVTTETQIFRFASFEAEAEPEPYHRRLLAPRGVGRDPGRDDAARAAARDRPRSPRPGPGERERLRHTRWTRVPHGRARRLRIRLTAPHAVRAPRAG